MGVLEQNVSTSWLCRKWRTNGRAFRYDYAWAVVFHILQYRTDVVQLPSAAKRADHRVMAPGLYHVPHLVWLNGQRARPEDLPSFGNTGVGPRLGICACFACAHVSDLTEPCISFGSVHPAGPVT